MSNNYCYYYEFDGLHHAFDIKLKLRHGTVFEFMNCKCIYHGLKEQSIVIVYEDYKNLPDIEAIEKAQFVAKILSFIFMVPIYSKDGSCRKVSWTRSSNDLLSKKNRNKLNIVETQILKLKKEKEFFVECINHLMIAYQHYYGEYGNDEDAFLYYFKIVEKIVKRSYMYYTELHLKNKKIKEDKKVLKEIIKAYSTDTLKVNLSDNILNSHTDYFYNEMFNQIYGNVFGKISFFLTSNNIMVDPNIITKLVKCRNKLAHGDVVEEDVIVHLLDEVRQLALNCISIYFFDRDYDELHIQVKIIDELNQWL